MLTVLGIIGILKQNSKGGIILVGTVDNHLDVLGRLTDYIRKNNLTVWLFGSYATGNVTATSDIDLLLESDNIPFPKLLDIAYDLKEIAGVEIDLLFTGYIDDQTTKLIKERGRKLWEV